MNNFKRNLLIVLIVGAMSTYSHGMAALIGEDDAKRMETPAPLATDEGSASLSIQVLSGQVPPALSSPRKKSELEKTVLPGSEAAKETPRPVTPEGGDSPASSSDSDREYVSAAEGKSPRGSKTGSAIKARPTATTDEFAQARAQVKKDVSADAKPASREVSAEILAVEGAKKADSSSALLREPSGDVSPVEEAMLRRTHNTDTTSASAAATSTSVEPDPAAGVNLSPAPEMRPTVTFTQADPKVSAAGLATEVKEMGGTIDAERLAAAAQARKGEAPIDLLDGKGEDAGSVSASSSSDSASATSVRASLGAAPVTDPAVDAAVAKSAALPKDSLLEKVKRNKLKTFALILALAEAADLTQAYFLKTTKEELQDKTFAQKAKLVAQKTYTVALYNTAKDGLINRVVPGILDLKQKAQDYLNKKKQAA